jgi:NitT/TauT family transport system substrate-binding protein
MGRGWSRVLVLLALGWAACAPAPRTPLVVGTVPWVGTEPLFLARELGLFDGPIHLAEYINSEHEIRAFQNGLIDAAAVTLDEVLNLDRLQQQAHVVLVLDASHGADCVVAQPTVTSVAELRGRKVATEEVTLPTYSGNTVGSRISRGCCAGARRTRWSPSSPTASSWWPRGRG